MSPDMQKHVPPNIRSKRDSRLSADHERVRNPSRAVGPVDPLKVGLKTARAAIEQLGIQLLAV